MTTIEKIASLRDGMAKNKVDAFIVFSADPHMSEYLPEKWKERAWLTGFTGSAGFAVITLSEAALWTDGRYFTQAAIELQDSGITLMKMGMDDTPNYLDWIISKTSANATISANALVTSHANWEEISAKLQHRKLVSLPLLQKVWNPRPLMKNDPIFHQSSERAGESATEKLTKIRKVMKSQGATAHILAALDDIAWTLNLRGNDIECNPVFLSYLLITESTATLFVDIERLEDEAKTHLKQAGIAIQQYNNFFNHLENIRQQIILLSSGTNQSVFDILEGQNRLIIADAPAHLIKAIKNEVEIDGFRKVMIRDGVAMVKFLYWLTHQAGHEEMNEYSISDKLKNFRAEGENFVGVSFPSIVGYQGNGAIIHYSPKIVDSAGVKNFGSILVDSGAQYLEGTTDITRTLPLGDVSDEFKHDATLVLKGMIDLAMAKFPKGTRGSQLDILARKPLWEEGKDYNHGTGHGVGSFLNVHEGPQSIRKEANPVVLQPGMVISDEPGYYLENRYGIRHENLILVKEWKKTQWNTFYEFETLTLCPFFKSIINKEMLSRQEIDWLNNYHKLCEEKLVPALEEEVNNDVKEWFLQMVAPL